MDLSLSFQDQQIGEGVRHLREVLPGGMCDPNLEPQPLAIIIALPIYQF